MNTFIVLHRVKTARPADGKPATRIDTVPNFVLSLYSTYINNIIEVLLNLYLHTLVNIIAPNKAMCFKIELMLVNVNTDSYIWFFWPSAIDQYSIEWDFILA